MSSPRFFVNSENVHGDKIVINGDEHVHLHSVLRIKIGDHVEVCCGDGKVFDGLVELVGKKESVVKIQSFRVEPKPAFGVTLFLAITKSERMDWAVQKCTELGIDTIIPFESQYCTAKDRGNKLDRLNRIAVSACKQSGRAYLPKIEPTITFAKLLSSVQVMPQVVLAYENDLTPAKQIISKLKQADVGIIIGSEGGFSQTEVNKLVGAGAKCVSLGENVLRVETAAVALTSVVMFQLDFWKKGK